MKISLPVILSLLLTLTQFFALQHVYDDHLLDQRIDDACEHCLHIKHLNSITPATQSIGLCTCRSVYEVVLNHIDFTSTTVIPFAARAPPLLS